ncbi:uncharacterized protein EDB91DRAFT_885798 [Suillus paluster]|uniref:uncharacterized protein n=1 Tax=Suillus paluster TaxID=48578 RepID=UPI001B87E945|nr:uncharacterized protein EDB91DRAFT_885798 [Suillus paluster]KAG1727754.1 hypothetical protein EDB91DRAFT_885798 [Suillus paluster]
MCNPTPALSVLPMISLALQVVPAVSSFHFLSRTLITLWLWIEKPGLSHEYWRSSFSPGPMSAPMTMYLEDVEVLIRIV